MDDDLELLAEQAREGNDAAVAELVRRTQPTVWRLCRSLGDGADVEDLVQDTYLRALKSLASYRGDAPVMAWLLSIARHVCADRVRQRQRSRRLFDRLTSVAVERTVTRGDRTMDDLVAALTPDRREAFVLTQELGLSYEEAALVMDCPVGTIRSRVARARADLADAVHRANAV
ncbi:MAG: RNA polymerase sigma factor [Actinomycetota bacterium]